MGFSARSLVVLALVLAPAVASAQGQTTPPAGTGAAPAPAPPGPSGGAPLAPGTADKPAEKPGGGGDVGGFSFRDKPVKRAARSGVKRNVSGPIAMMPGFEQTPEGGSRFFVQLTQQVPVEERRAQGAITYVLKGAHVNKHNNTNALVTVHFNTPVSRARLVPQGNDLIFTLDLRAAVAPTYKLQEAPDKTAMLVIDFPKGDFLTSAENVTAAPEERPAESGGERPDQPAPKKKGTGTKKKRAASPPPPPGNGPTP